MSGGKRSIRRNTCSTPLCPPKIPSGLAWNRTRSYTIRGWRITATNDDDDSFEQEILQMTLKLKFCIKCKVAAMTDANGTVSRKHAQTVYSQGQASGTKLCLNQSTSSGGF